MMFHALYPPFVTGRGALGLLALRLVTGMAFILHGLPKIQQPFTWMGPGAPVPIGLQALAALAEFGGGIAIVLGILTPIAALGILCNMCVALLMVHFPHHDPFVAAKSGEPSFEPALSYLAIMITLLTLGPGSLSLDAALFRRKRGALAHDASLP